MITVDLPPEEDAPLRTELAAHGLAVIRLATPTTTEKRMETVANGSSGFVYYVSVAGVTGAGIGSESDISAGVERARRISKLPVAVGFGVRTPEQAAVLRVFLTVSSLGRRWLKRSARRSSRVIRARLSSE